jgi:hypothetical protein
MSDTIFNEVHKTTENSSGINMAFIQSLKIQAFPCGRRRGFIYGNTPADPSDDYYIPFDPESRLNTEDNNRKHTSLNGFTDSYIKSWTGNKLELVVGGYFFSITANQNDFTTFDSLKSGTAIYANILLHKVPLLSGDDLSYNSYILRNQSATSSSDDNLPSTEIDLLRAVVSGETQNKDFIENKENYYFSGLSFTTVALTKDNTGYTDNQQRISLQILEKVEGAWRIYQPALLPKIEHGEEEDSVKVKKLIVEDSIKLGSEGISVPSLKVVELESGKYQLQFSNVTVSYDI